MLGTINKCSNETCSPEMLNIQESFKSKQFQSKTSYLVEVIITRIRNDFIGGSDICKQKDPSLDSSCHSLDQFQFNDPQPSD